MTQEKELEQAAHNYANKKKLQIGGIDVWAFMEIFTDGATFQAQRIEKWIRVKDLLPERENSVFTNVSKSVLFISQQGKQHIGFINLTENIWKSPDGFTETEASKVTHWTPLPEPPPNLLAI